MQFDPSTPRVDRVIGAKEGPSFTVSVPAPFAAEQSLTLTAGLANILNQTIAENLSNNLRAKLVAGVEAITDEAGNVTTAAREFTAAEAQSMVDAYLTEYEPGVRRAGDAVPRVTDPIEREVRSLANAAARALVKTKGVKWADIDGAAVIAKLIEVKGDEFRARAREIVRSKAKAALGEDMTLDSLLAG